MGNTASIHNCYKYVTDRICCRAENDVERGGKYFCTHFPFHKELFYSIPVPSHEISRIGAHQNSFYIPSTTTIASNPSSTSSARLATILTPHSSQATTISKSSSAEEEIQNWYDIDLPRVYRPLSAPVDMPDSMHHRRGDRGTIIFMPEKRTAASELSHKEIPGIHKTVQKRSLWTKTKDRVMGGRRRQVQLQNYLTKHKSDEIKPDVKTESETSTIPCVTRLHQGMLESDL